MQDLQDIIVTHHPTPLFLWWQWALLSLAALIILWLLFTFLTRKKRTKTPETSPIQQAIQKLKTLSQQSLDSNQTAIQLSLIIREYLQARLQDPALFETDEELDNRTKDLDKLPASISPKLKQYLHHVATLKYAPKSSAKASELCEKASELLNSMEQQLQPKPTTP